MSESGQPPASGADEPARSGAAPARARYPRSSGGLIGAMIVTVLAVLAFTAFRAITRDNEPTPVRAVDYTLVVEGARADAKLLVMAPERLPAGWVATSASYGRGVQPTWHLGTLTADRNYVGVEEARAGIEDLVTEHVDRDAERGADVTIAGETWQTWTDAGGDYAVARSLRSGDETVESWLVVGTAPPATIREFAGTLEGRPLQPGE